MRSWNPTRGWRNTFPNLLTTFRLLLFWVPGFFLMVQLKNYALISFALIAITDFFDGFIARTFPSQKSAWGATWDSRADALFGGTTIISIALFQEVLLLEQAMVASVFAIEYIVQKNRAGEDKPGYARVKFFVFMTTTLIVMMRGTSAEEWLLANPGIDVFALGFFAIHIVLFSSIAGALLELWYLSPKYKK